MVRSTYVRVFRTFIIGFRDWSIILGSYMSLFLEKETS